MAIETQRHPLEVSVQARRLKSDDFDARTVSSPDAAPRPARLTTTVGLMDKRGAGQSRDIFPDVLLPITSKLPPSEPPSDDILSQKRLIDKQNSRKIVLTR